MAQQQQPPRSPQLSEQIIEQMVRQQSQQIEVRLRELSLQEKNIEQQAKYADKVLAAQADDLKHTRDHEGRQSGKKLLAGVVTLVLVLAFLATCILTGHEAAAIEIVKAVAFVFTGGLGGYAIGRSKRDKTPDDATNEQ